MKTGDLAYCKRYKFEGIITDIKIFTLDELYLENTLENRENIKDFNWVVIEKGNIICHTKIENINIITHI